MGMMCSTCVLQIPNACSGAMQAVSGTRSSTLTPGQVTSRSRLHSKALVTCAHNCYNDPTSADASSENSCRHGVRMDVLAM